MDLKETDILDTDISNHWYYASKARAMTCFLDGFTPSLILDVGAGSGFFSRHLLEHSNGNEAWCVDTGYEVESDEENNKKTIHFRRSISNIDADLVLLMDVLEHVDNDVSLLKEYVAKVPKGTVFLVTVPAFQFLWSGHDNYLEHKRRYTLKHLESVVEMAGLKVNYGAYYFGMIFPLVASLRLVQKIIGNSSSEKSQLEKHSYFVNMILKFFCRFELIFMRINRFAGLTVFCLAEKV